MARRLVAAALVLLLLVALVAVGVGVWSARRPLPQTDGTLRLDALDGRVDVYRDGFGVPHVYAETAHDLFFAQGFIHAQDRFWEMDIRRHTTAGRLAELFGPDQVPTDRFIRTMGWRRVAEEEWELLSEPTRRMFRDYAEGVNAYLAQREPAELALEYQVLGLRRPGYRPEPWSPIDSLAWLKAMAWDLRSNLEDEIQRVALSATLPVERVEELWPPFPFDLRRPAVPQGAAQSGGTPSSTEDTVAEGTRSEVLAARRLLTRLGDHVAAMPPLLGRAGQGLGSNAFVVHGDRTATGLPLLANDPHLDPSQPSIWYQMALHCRTVTEACPWAVTGFTFAGMPGVIIGHNQRIAWGFTNMAPDVADLVLERVFGDSYEHGGGMLPLTQRTETIRVAGGEDVQFTVRETGHGPLLSDASDDLRLLARNAPAGQDAAAGGDGTELAVALRWTALRPGRTADALIAVNLAANWDDFRAAAAMFDVPAQNMVYADVDGNIGYQAPGWIPVRAPGDDGRWPVPGWTGDHDWQGRVPFSEMPSMLNPPEGVIVTANQPVVGPEERPYLSRDHSYGWRSQRLWDLLHDAQDLQPADMARAQGDTHNGIAEVLVPLLTAVDVPGGVQPAQELLAEWNLRQDADSAGAAYFAGVWRHLLRRTFGDELPEDAPPDGGDRWMEVVRRIADDADNHWWDDAGTAERETRDDMFRAAMADAAAELSEQLGDEPDEWRWGDLHTLDLQHPTLGSSGIAPIERLFNRGPVAVSGGSAIPNATGWDAGVGYGVNLVPSMRMVVDLADWDAARWINLTGVSGHPFSRHYTDQVERWASNETVPMRWSEAAVLAAATDHLVLAPTGAAGGAGGAPSGSAPPAAASPGASTPTGSPGVADGT